MTNSTLAKFVGHFQQVKWLTEVEGSQVKWLLQQFLPQSVAFSNIDPPFIFDNTILIRILRHLHCFQS